ncbi:DUF2969 family protein [Vagococcus sp.]|uniref:DUF2969 family protein n=1 Tax=Vagococcus sp. TaxID=1933889 RepID=UPI003F971B32
MKKNKPIEVSINEIVKDISGTEQTVYEVLIGKKIIGEVSEIIGNKFQVNGLDDFKLTSKSLDDAIEELLKHWNLNN